MHECKPLETGIVCMSPGEYKMGKDDVCFAIAGDAAQITPVSHRIADWVALFRRRRSVNASHVDKTHKM
jgi:hypothetical protein